MDKTKTSMFENVPWKLIGVLALVLVLSSIGWFTLTSVLSPYDATSETETPTSSMTHITLISYKDGEDVSNFVPISIYAPDYDSDYDASDNEHIHPDSLTGTYWNREIDASHADDVSIDLTDTEYQGWFYVEIDPNDATDFSNNHHLMYSSGANTDITLYVYHQSTDVYFTNFNRSDGTIMIPRVAGNYSAEITGFPIHEQFDWSEKHVGTDWDMSTSDYNDLTDAEKADYNNEELWTIQEATYDPTADTDEDYSEGLELYTNVFAWKLKFNRTISSTDGDDAQINITLSDITNDEVEYIVSGQYVYFAAAKNVDVGFSLDYELDFDEGKIVCEDMYGGRLTIPDDDASSISYSAFSFSMT